MCMAACAPTPRLDHVFATICDLHEAVSVDGGDVSSVEPALFIDCCTTIMLQQCKTSAPVQSGAAKQLLRIYSSAAFDSTTVLEHAQPDS